MNNRGVKPGTTAAAIAMAIIPFISGMPAEPTRPIPIQQIPQSYVPLQESRSYQTQVNNNRRNNIQQPPSKQAPEEDNLPVWYLNYLNRRASRERSLPDSHNLSYLVFCAKPDEYTSDDLLDVIAHSSTNVIYKTLGELLWSVKTGSKRAAQYTYFIKTITDACQELGIKFNKPCDTVTWRTRVRTQPHNRDDLKRTVRYELQAPRKASKFVKEDLFEECAANVCKDIAEQDNYSLALIAEELYDVYEEFAELNDILEPEHPSWDFYPTEEDREFEEFIASIRKPTLCTNAEDAAVNRYKQAIGVASET